MKKPARTISPEILDSIKKYYTSAPLELSVIPDINFRHFRLRLPNGSFYKVKRKIRGPSDLRKTLIDKSPLDVYYSTASWLNPQLIASKLDPDILKNVMISCDLAFDIDVNKDIATLEDARLNAVELADYLDSKGIKVRYTAFSGSKGFHVVCDDPWREENLDGDPRKRESYAVERRKELVEELKGKDILFDQKVTVDSRRIIRVPGTVNSKTGYVCSLLSRKMLESSTETIFKSLEHIRSFTPRISRLWEMTSPSAYKISGVLGRLGVRPSPKPNLRYSTFFSNNIPNTRLKIPVMEFGNWMKTEKMESIIEEIQDTYGLGDVALFSDKTRYWAISLKAVSQRRVEKILFTSGSLNINQCKKYGCTYTRVGKSIGVNGEIVQDEPILIKILESDLRGQVSRTHYEFLSQLGVKFRDGNLEMCGAGKEKLELVHAIIE